ncbi:lysine-2,3-aminomutase-like protein [Alsobacter sp. SYSU M60028]|uniref:Lysine-2,3-aminomutase-like protein n=1 Tax=Alsobacter ponti TaxID=2962936 RepID=A0ABT1LD11_9HYPH|nr:lysine-2,3-aminomutase-like protein [Alsobacter ponti]MCP8938783.1 lysine-2,3-aminomutase-like protein [Alsobacter ponti]
MTSPAFKIAPQEASASGAASASAVPVAPRTLRTATELAWAGLVPEDAIAALDEVSARYAISVTPAVAGLVDRADPGDPIARQFVPDVRELAATHEERADPIGDEAHSPVEGVVHRYPDRALLKLADVCAVYCRFCFRREMVGPGGTGMLSPEALEGAYAYFRAHPEIWEVIVTGGDPLVLSPRRVREVTQALGAIPHVKVLRWHTRVPAVAPERVTQAMVEALTCSDKTVYVALHANHPRELTPSVRAACARMADAGIAMVSQSVLLKGVNDDVETLAALMRGFVEARVKPYYLHQGDLAPGTSHLRTTIEEGRALVAALRGRVSGLCQPHYVLDIPGGHGKAPIAPDAMAAGLDAVTDYRGQVHVYPPEAEG